MALFGSLLGAGVSLAGSLLGGRQRSRGAQAALAAGRATNTAGPFGNLVVGPNQLELQLIPGLQSAFGGAEMLGMRELRNLLDTNFEAREDEELERLRALRQPGIAQARSALQSRLAASGRLGLARGGGRTGQLFSPQTAALEEAILAADLGDIGAARNLARSDEAFRLGQARGAFGLQREIASGLFGQSQFGLPSNPQAGGLFAAGAANARDIGAFGGALGNRLADLELDQLFGGARLPPVLNIPSTFGGGLRNSSGGFFL